MKKTLLSIMGTAICLSTFAQVYITKSSFVTTQKKFVQYYDTAMIAVQTANAGANIWDMTNLKRNENANISVYNADHLPAIKALSPNADLIFYNSSDEAYILAVLSDSALAVTGYAYEDMSNQFVFEEFKLDIMRFPITTGTNINGTTKLLSTEIEEFPIALPPGAPTIDSVRVKAFANQSFTGKGHGKIMFANSEVDNVLMVESQSIYSYVIDAQIRGTWVPLPLDYYPLLGFGVESDTIITHEWISGAAGNGFPVLSYEFSKGETQAEGADFISEPIQATSLKNAQVVNAIAYPNPSDNVLLFSGLDNADGLAKIYNTNGQLVYSFTFTNNTLDLSTVAKGNYVITIAQKEGIAQFNIVRQ